jgi:hypothetical protein
MSVPGDQASAAEECLTLWARLDRLPFMPLSDRDRRILDFERTWWIEPGPKEQAIRSRLDLSPTRYYQRLAELMETDEALAYDPLVVRRLRRVRQRRRRARLDGGSAGERR